MSRDVIGRRVYVCCLPRKQSENPINYFNIILITCVYAVLGLEICTCEAFT